MLNEELREQLGRSRDPQIALQLALLEQMEELNTVLLKLAENFTSCTITYNNQSAVRTDQI